MSVTLASIHELATHLRTELAEKKFILLYAYNGTGKTRLSMKAVDQATGEDLSKKQGDQSAEGGDEKTGGAGQGPCAEAASPPTGLRGDQ